MDAEIKMAFFLVTLGADFNQRVFFFSFPFHSSISKEKKNSSERNWSCSQDKWA